MSSSEAGYYFQTDTSIAVSAFRSKKSTNKLGNPINLKSKILAGVVDPWNRDRIWLALAVGEIRAVNLESGTISPPLKPITVRLAPLTCLAVSSSNDQTGTLFAGSWDKNIYSFPLSPSSTQPGKVFKGHSDFIKALLVIPNTSILISASADSSIIVWDTQTGALLSKLMGHTRGVQALALSLFNSESQTWRIYSGDSTGELRAWSIPILDLSGAHEVALPLNGSSGYVQPLRVHETSIFGLHIVPAEDDEDEEIWTASASKDSKSVSAYTGAVDLTLEHPDFVKAVTTSEGVVITGCRDSDVRIWSSSTGKLLHVLRGHFDEITDLVVANGRLASMSIDGTLRTWNLATTELARTAGDGEKLENRGWGPEEVEEKKKTVALTEDEERELAELMEDDD